MFKVGDKVCLIDSAYIKDLDLDYLFCLKAKKSYKKNGYLTVYNIYNFGDGSSYVVLGSEDMKSLASVDANILKLYFDLSCDNFWESYYKSEQTLTTVQIIKIIKSLWKSRNNKYSKEHIKALLKVLFHPRHILKRIAKINFYDYILPILNTILGFSISVVVGTIFILILNYFFPNLF